MQILPYVHALGTPSSTAWGHAEQFSRLSCSSAWGYQLPKAELQQGCAPEVLPFTARFVNINRHYPPLLFTARDIYIVVEGSDLCGFHC